MKTGQKHRFTICVVLVLAACSGPAATEDPAVVLERASSKAQSLESAAFDTRFSYDASAPEMAVSGTAEGVLADGGRQLSFWFDADVTIPGEGMDQTVSVSGDVVVADENETYLRIDRADGSVMMLPGVGLVPAEMLDTWFRIGSSSGVTAVTPDPSFMAMQTQTLTVTKDRSFEDVDGHDCYTYDVTIDRAKMLAFLERTAQERAAPFDRTAVEAFLASYDASGTVWIDAETSVIRRITWNFKSATDTPDMNASFTVHFKNHDDPVEIIPPADAKSFSEDDVAQPSLPLF